MTRIFVFGSNLAGRHGKGAALWARRHRGAIYGQGYGMQGESFAIPTKDASLRTLPLEEVERWVIQFLAFARCRPDLIFELTPIGCGLAGYRPKDIAPMFRNAAPNVELPAEFTGCPAEGREHMWKPADGGHACSICGAQRSA